MVRPAKSSHGLLKKVQRLSKSDIQIITGAVSAMFRKRSSLSCNAASARLRSVVSMFTPIMRMGLPCESRNTCPLPYNQ